MSSRAHQPALFRRVQPILQALRALTHSAAAAATKQPDGQNFAFAVGQITSRTHAILSPGKGRWPSSPNVGMGCGGRGGVGREVCSQGGSRERATARRTYDAEAYGE